MSTVDIAEDRRLLAAVRGNLERIHEYAAATWSSEDADELRRVVRKIDGQATAALNAEALLAGTPDLDVERLARAQAEVFHGPDHLKGRDRCDSCIESAEQVIARLREAPDGR